MLVLARKELTSIVVVASHNVVEPAGDGIERGPPFPAAKILYASKLTQVQKFRGFQS